MAGKSKPKSQDNPERPKLPVEHRYPAGGVLVRRVGEAVEICLLRPQGGKPRWMIPKGMIDPGERAPQTAVREVLEETGHRGVVVGDKLGDVEYLVTWTSTAPRRCASTRR